jgi:pyruvate kinase
MTHRLWQRTKIVCTLGPATDPRGVLEELVGTGMDVARVNMSHGNHADHLRRIQRVREVSAAMNQPVAVLADLPGPKFRIGKLDGGSRKLHDGAVVFLAEQGTAPECLPVRHRELLHALRIGDSVYLADGSIELRVEATTPDHVACQVTVGGTVRSGSGINVPDSDLPALVPTEDDRIALAFAVSQGVEWIGVSFVQSADDLARVRSLLPIARKPLLMAKIETRRALETLEAIVEAADGVMVARGDLGVETDLAEIAVVQKHIIATVNVSARPVVTATQMLESMVEHEYPTRAEVTDVANAVLDGTDAVMLSAETAVGRHPATAVKILQRILASTEAVYAPRIVRARLQTSDGTTSDQAVGFAACQLAERLGARAIILSGGNLPTATAIARFRPHAPIVVLTDSDILCSGLTVVSGVSLLYGLTRTSMQARIAEAREWLYTRALAQPGDQVIVLSASAAAQDPADTLQIVRLSG